MHSIAIIGSGPTAIYTAAHLVANAADSVLRITLYEAQVEGGRGTPYHPDWNDPAMLANIASIEIPPIVHSLEEWLHARTDEELHHWNIKREQIDPRTFFPRVVLGEYFQSELQALVMAAQARGIALEIMTEHRVVDIAQEDNGNVRLMIATHSGEIAPSFDYVVMATGHAWPENVETHGYFRSPWPASALRSIGNVHVGIRGTSLSAIDAVVALATARGKFDRDSSGNMQYVPAAHTEKFQLTLMSRKGLLPEADFFHPIPYEPLSICTPAAIEALIAQKPPKLLDEIFELFRQELLNTDPDYAVSIELEALSLEQFCRAYFHMREESEPFAWAAKNLAEAQANYARRHTIPWRYAILRMHESVALGVPHLSRVDHGRFMRYFKAVFVDDYATVPHESIERLLALRACGKINILRIGDEYMLDTRPANGGAVLHYDDKTVHFPAFIEAIGQKTLSLRDFPFPTLRAQGIARESTEPSGGIILDEKYRLHNAKRLFCLSLPFILSRAPFAQGITSSHDMGSKVADSILEDVKEQDLATVLADEILSA